MSRLILGGIVCCLVLRTAYAIPACAQDDEDCRESRMHPDLLSERGRLTSQSRIAGEETTEYWLDQGKQFVKEKLHTPANQNIAKNVIMFLGDGMGITTHSAARTLLGGEEKSLYFETFPHTGLSRTFNVDKIVPDSASTATAYLCGVKAIGGTIGVSGHVDRTDCVGSANVTYHVNSIAKWAVDAGKSAGVVTTTRITHASPAGVYAHVAERDWENDSEVKGDCGTDTVVQDIAYQLIHGEVGSKLSVILGGGKREFIDSELYAAGKRSDGRNLIEEYKQQSSRNAYVETLDELNSVNVTEVDRLLGLFQDNHLLYHLETNEQSNQPTLAELTRKSIEFLSRNDEGYFIFIEGGRIDHGHHDTYARLALDETLEFAKAIQLARELTNETDTLIVVTADHSHAMSYSGYAERGNDIFGSTSYTGKDGQPFMTLSYANGPSYEKFVDVQQHARRDPTTLITGAIYDSFPSTIPLDSETHGGDDVAVFASGPWAHLFSGVYNQNTIPHMMAYASCVGSGLKACSTTN
ncbi:membrane-bound alkaline phosphatase-like [Bactrocera neohumeralis]|uniref:membrane-bound alkaline phosphatase-like n=1 Tax=Bactrocera neohumeralis TaxID=98809 RepID=UPI0021669C67|nr:membrane-bound alkaline phosphatase-like [Bactrocera neohumeralis]